MVASQAIVCRLRDSRDGSESTTLIVSWWMAGVLVALAPSVLAGGEVSFADQIAPIFAQHCVGCHTPGIEKGGLSLATPNNLLEQGLLVAGDPDGSYLLDMISPSDDAPPEMPLEGPPLTAEQVALIRDWVGQGAEWPEGLIVREQPKADASWWSLQPIADPKPPTPEELPAGWTENAIDRFVFDRLQREGLKPNPPAAPRTLRRRVTYGLTGLPPQPDDAELPVDELAYKHLIDDLLASHAYGEHWGRHWLDVVRFGESRGYERNEIINTLWPFRDYVIRSFNADKPFDKLVREHLAGDLAKEDTDSQIGSAFLVAGPSDSVNNQDAAQAAQIRANAVDEVIRTTSEAFLGLTFGCARCHDHKFDPILQSDYYRLYSTFAGVRQGEGEVATMAERKRHKALTAPLSAKRKKLRKQHDAITAAALARGEAQAESLESRWTRDPPKRGGVTETFTPIQARYVRLVSEGTDTRPQRRSNFRIDEFEVWSHADESNSKPRNVALASAGGRAFGSSIQVEDFANAYSVQLVNDGEFGGFFISTDETLTIELPEPSVVDRVVFSSARGERISSHNVFTFLSEYRIEVSDDGEAWTVVADSHDRRPVSEAHLKHRLLVASRTADDRHRLGELDRAAKAVEEQLAKILPLPKVWIGKREKAAGPFHVMIGGDPMRPGEQVTAGSLTVVRDRIGYELSSDAPEGERRERLAAWIADSDNPLTARVLVNRVWHYHFGKGLVDTPSDFGYMGGKPTHPELLDWLASRLIESGWRLKPIHRLILSSQTYRQSSLARAEALERDADSRLLWRFPPRRLAAEELRDTMLAIAERLGRGNGTPDKGGPGFRLYKLLEDNVSTYVPRDEPGPDTYRRAVYHQNARAAPVDLLAEFDQPDCAFSTSRRNATTTPLQALTLFNHRFTLDMAEAFAERLAAAAEEDTLRIQQAFKIALDREPTIAEQKQCLVFAQEHGWPALCRVLLNTTELITIH